MCINSLSSLLILLSLGVLPPLSIAYLGASSMALGLALALIITFFRYVKKLTVLKKIPKILLFFICVIVLHTLILHVQFIFFDTRAYITFFVLLFVLTMAFFLSKLILDGVLNVDQSVKYLFLVLFSFALISLVTKFKLGEIFYGHHKTIFPFNEPSHFALYFGPFFFLFLFQLSSFSKQILLILAVSLLSVFIGSTTLLIYATLAFFLFVRMNAAGVFLVGPMLIFGVFYVLNEPYFLSRMILSTDSENLTSLVYLQGLTDAYDALINTKGLGLGFQMLGTQPHSDVFYQIQSVLGQGLDGGGLNTKDGGFVAAKLVAEFGVVGLILLGSYLVLFFKVFLKLRRFIKKPNDIEPAYIFSLVFIYASFVEIFVRGVGYFSPSLFLFFTALFVYNYYKKRYKSFEFNCR